jgi:ATP-dependent DNA helicase RecG
MNDEQLIKKLIKQGEGEQLEFKEAVRKEDIAKALCAFLNANGGIVLIGVQDDGKIIGVSDAEKQEEELKNYLFTSIIPEAPVTVSKEVIGNKNILFAKVWNGSKPPYVFNGTIYFRKGGNTVKATPNNISALIAERQKNELHWERRPALGIEIEDLDELEIRKTLKDLAQFGRGRVFSEKQVEEFLTYYGLYQNGNLTNAAVVLFAKEPTRYFPQCRVRLTVLKGTKASDQFSYDRVLEGNLFRNTEEILQFFEVNIAVSSRFSDKKWKRIDTPFPKLALREGLMNALIHRDYSNVSGSAIIAFYPDHLEITNYGELPSELKPADLARNHLSLPRNPDIAHICFLRAWIEKIGRGTIKMIEDCEEKGFPKPIWQSKSGVTTLVFPEITVTAKIGDTISDAVSDTVNDALNDAVKKKKIDTVSDTVSDTLIDIVNYVATNEKGVSITELIKKANKSSATVKRYLQTLKAIGIIEFKGAAKTGKYFVNKTALARIKRNK